MKNLTEVIILNTFWDRVCGFGMYSVISGSNGLEISGFDISKKSVELTKKILNHYNFKL